MAYTIVKSDGTTLTTIANGTINTSSTSVALPGRNYAGYGEYLDTNFVHMLENFADSTVPSNPLRGQLWYNTTSSTMYICPTDGETNAANWYAVTTASSSGNTTLGNLTVNGNILANNITATNNLDANAISCNYLTVNVSANMAAANFSGTANAAILRTTSITTGSQSTTGIMTGVWTANGAGTPAGGPSGTSFYVIGGNLVISNTSSRGLVADYIYFSNGSPWTSGGGTYSNSNVQAYLPVYGGNILTDKTTANILTTGSAGTAGTITGNWSLSGGSKLSANTVLDAAQPNITSVGNLSSLTVTANITAGNANLGNLVRANYFSGDGYLISNLSIGAGTSIVNGTSNVVVAAGGNVTVGVSGTSGVITANNVGVFMPNAYVTTNVYSGNAVVTSNVNAGNLNGILANLGTSNVRIVSAAGNVVTTVGGTSTLTVTSTGANITGTLNTGAGNANVGNIGATTGVFTTINGNLTNGTSNVNIVNNGNINLVRAGTTRLVVSGSGITVTGSIDATSTITAAGNIQANSGAFFVGDGGYLSNIVASAGTSIVNGTSNVVVASGSNVTVGIGGGANRLVITSTGTNIAGYANVVGNANIGNVGTATIIASTAANTPLIQNGTSNIRIASGSNVGVSVAGTSNVLLTTSTGINVAGTVNATGTGVVGNVLVINSTTGVTEGAQIVMAYANTTGLTAAGANSWNIDVTTANAFRIFRDTAGSSLVALDINQSTGNFTVTGNILCANDVVAYSSSDSRLKENIVPIENALDKIKRISGVMFDWKDGHEIDRKHDTGLIAQEVEEVLPEVVVTRPSGFKAVRYEKIMGLVVQAIKELSDQVDELKRKD